MENSKKVTRTLMNLRKMSDIELEGVMVELRDKIEELCLWGSDTDAKKMFTDQARDLSTDTKYLETKADLINYIRKADTIIMKDLTITAMLNHTLAK